MNTLMRKFIISLLSVIFAISILGTVTYAWFSLARTNALDNLSLSVSTGDEFQISMDGVNYYKEIPSSVVMEHIADTLELKDVTSTDGVNFLQGGPNGTDVATKNVDYCSMQFWFRTTRAERHVYLVNKVNDVLEYDEGRNGTYVVSRGINWKADNTFLYDVDQVVHTGDRGNYYAADAIRIGFVEEKITENELDTRLESELSRKIFDLSKKPERGYGALFGGLAYYNVKHATNITPPSYIPNTVYNLTTFDPYNPYVPLDRNSRILEMIKTNTLSETEQVYYIGKLTVNIWLEGWDADCFNSVYSDQVRIQLQFKAANSLITSM